MARLVLILAAWAALIGLASGQSSPLERAKTLRDIADQRIDAETREAVAIAEKLARTHSEKALRDLKLMARNLDLRTDISSTKREELIALIQGKIRSIEAAPGSSKPPVVDPKVVMKRDETRKALERFDAEAKEVNDTIAAIKADYEANRVKEAERKAADLAKKYPNNPAAFTMLGNASIQDKIANARLYAFEQRERILLALRSVDKSALPAIGDIEYPANWKELSERRLKQKYADLYGPEEMKILETLEKPVTLKFKEGPFEETVQSLSTAMNLNIYLDKQSLEDLAVDLKRSVQIPQNVSGRTALRAVLQSVGLTFIIKDKVLQVVSVEKARQNYVTRAYDVSDLVRSGPFNSPVLWGPFVDYQQTMQNAEALLAMIRKQIDPLVWDQQGTTATFHYPTMSIIIRAPSEVHATLGRSLKR